MPAHPGADFPRPPVFWAGVATTLAGLLLQLPDVVAARHMHYRMSGMGMSATMTVGMVLLGLGAAVATAGLIQPRPAASAAALADGYRIESTGEKLTARHVRLVAVLSVALVIDVMKPATLAFIEPGMREEYGISVTRVSVLPTVALTGTVAGSLLWGLLGDRIGRRATILMSSVIFVSTTACAVMPTFDGNLFMCFSMGTAAGGLLPIVYALMAETLPAARRSVVMVLQAGLASVAAYFLTSGLATLLIPAFGWRSMWFAQLPLVLVVLALNGWIPESPRFLLQHGRLADARASAAAYGMTLSPRPEHELVAPPTRADRPQRPARRPPSAVAALFEPQILSRTLVAGAYGLSWGCLYWGFMTFVPTLLKKNASIGSSGSQLLFLSSLLAIPGTALVAYVYVRWSSRKAMVLYGSLSVASLLLLAATNLRGGRAVVMVLLMLLIAGTSGVAAMLAPYAAEIHPTRSRAAGSGLIAACGKGGGIFAPPALASVLTHFPGVRTIALVVAVPMALGTLAVALKGAETTGRELEDLGPVLPAGDDSSLTPL
jgi:putative MFS transporter